MLPDRHLCRERRCAVEGKSNELEIFLLILTLYSIDPRAEKGLVHTFRCSPSQSGQDETCYLDR
jgi:hypothetical protein